MQVGDNLETIFLGEIKEKPQTFENYGAEEGI